jgi:nucleoside-diphosphate kinase
MSSGIPDPPFFNKLGPKDRGQIRQNIEAHAAQERKSIMSSSEQT